MFRHLRDLIRPVRHAGATCAHIVKDKHPKVRGPGIDTFFPRPGAAADPTDQ